MTEYKMTKLGFQIGKANRKIKQYLDKLAKEKGLDDQATMNGFILKYLSDHRDEDIFQKDLERHFSIAKSYVTGILQSMETRGWIERLSVPGDARLKKIVLTQAGEEVHLQLAESIREMEETLQGLMKPEEVRLLTEILNKIDQGLN